MTQLSLLHSHTHACSACALFAFSSISLWGRIVRPVKGLYQKGKRVVGGMCKSVGKRRKRAAQDMAEQKVSPRVDAVLFPVPSGVLLPFLLSTSAMLPPRWTSLAVVSLTPISLPPLPPVPHSRNDQSLYVRKLLHKRASCWERDGQSCCEPPSAE